jgi:hypothetical protein
VQALNTSNTRFYIHVDGKADISLFTEYEYPDNVVFINNRVVVTHAGFSTAVAMYNLINAALLDSQNDYFLFLSGWDYPIKHRDRIVEFLDTHYPMNFINFYPLTGNADLVEYIRKYYFTDFIGRSPRLLQKPLKALQYYVVAKLPLNRAFLPGMVPYRGSQGLCINRETAVYSTDYLKTENGKKYFRFFEHVLSADEMVFHTLILNSPYAQYCRYYERDIKNSTTPMKNENKAYLHFIDWNQRRENPAILGINDLEKLVQSDALFARKFNEVRSKPLLDVLDQKIGVA